MKYRRCSACAGIGYLDVADISPIPCADCCSFGWIDRETGTPADVEPPLFTLTEEGALHDHAHA